MLDEVEIHETVAETPPDVEGDAAEILEPVHGAPEVEASQPRVEAEQIQVPAVQILVKRDPEGNIECDVAATGDVRATEVETIIKMGLNKWRGKIGLPG